MVSNRFTSITLDGGGCLCFLVWIMIILPPYSRGFFVVYSMFAGLIIIAAFFASSVAMPARRQIVHIVSGPYDAHAIDHQLQGIAACQSRFHDMRQRLHGHCAADWGQGSIGVGACSLLVAGVAIGEGVVSGRVRAMGALYRPQCCGYKRR